MTVASDAKPLIEVRHVSRTFPLPGGGQMTVLEDINLKVFEGEFLAILGPSGSGKSTLLRIITGLLPPSSGQVLYRGQDIRDAEPGVAMVFQGFALYPWLTVLQNVELGLEARGVPRAERQRRALEAIDLVGLDGFEHAFPRELSGGMKQRVGLARALVVEPDVLVMDEPFSSLDVLTAENLRSDLLELWVDRRIPTRAIILVTHSIEDAVFMADRAVVLSRDPARVVAEVPIGLPHRRDREAPRFKALVDHIYALLTTRRHEDPRRALSRPGDVAARPEVAAPAGAAAVPSSPGPAGASPWRPRPLPLARAGALNGFIELLEESDGKEDLYELGARLHLGLEDLLPIVDACELLGLCRVSAGDVELTAEGVRYAAAGVAERKELFRRQALSCVPEFEWILAVLRSKANHRMPREFFLDILERRYGSVGAQRQLETLIDWGRYAELFAYDEASRMLFLEDHAYIPSSGDAESPS